MNFTAYVDRQRRAVRAEHFCLETSVDATACAAERGEESQTAQYFERLSEKLFKELDALRGFRREEAACC